MRLGGQVFLEDRTPDSWANALKQAGFRAAPCPVSGSDAEELNAYVAAARANDILISEVGAWSNPISRDEKIRREAIAYCKQRLDAAERIGAGCCVNIAGSRSEQWDGPDPDNFSDDTFALIVDTTREIIDAVKPKRTVFALEMMPWVFPDSADSYLALIQAIDRKGFGVHFDPVNIVSSPRIYYRTGDMIRDFFAKLGPYIRNCHAKDIKLGGKLTVHLDEVIPGQGVLDYRAFLTELNQLDPDVSLIIEHLHTNEDYAQAADYIRKTAAELNIAL
ncbi:sugar phosphate isomerase/epimerase family protein [Cohnella lubricantis]|uniref:Sugar phosphate isomerase/epimerase n=1 Tax=Cohnella lubricantis TaxID=2163172 RepID=A0A841TC63_9BACL|nr:sugar phosphate isomerase/epimerase family protein [Cohnella lubricantis]MBB6679063.1 sugar phosphate isomerase/epimerase [Cohnella lubricantis]MBP2117150.1 sugar phosphate isomerase/epimerase [Cohnella lubricantis]